MHNFRGKQQEFPSLSTNLSTVRILLIFANFFEKISFFGSVLLPLEFASLAGSGIFDLGTRAQVFILETPKSTDQEDSNETHESDQQSNPKQKREVQAIKCGTCQRVRGLE